MHLQFIGEVSSHTYLLAEALGFDTAGLAVRMPLPTISDAGAGEGTYQSYLSQGAPVPAYSGRALAPTAISAAEVGYVTQSGLGLAPSAVSYQEVTGPG